MTVHWRTRYELLHGWNPDDDPFLPLLTYLEVLSSCQLAGLDWITGILCDETNSFLNWWIHEDNILWMGVFYRSIIGMRILASIATCSSLSSIKLHSPIHFHSKFGVWNLFCSETLLCALEKCFLYCLFRELIFITSDFAAKGCWDSSSKSWTTDSRNTVIINVFVHWF